MADRVPGPDGLAIVDKPAGWTSHDVVARSRGLLGTRKVGHAGTLDPDATGVLLLGVGRGTRLLRYLSPLGKHYEGVMALGVETSTLDAAGEITATHDMAGTTLADVRAVVAEHFTGPILQVPPMVSALKVDGVRLHQLARQGIEIERDARPVEIHAIDVAEVVDDPLAFLLSVHCSSGTYIRSLAADIGRSLGGGAHLRSLRRTAVGAFTSADAVPLESLAPDAVLPLTSLVRGMASVEVDGELATDVGFGKVLSRGRLGLDASEVGPWAILGPDGALLAVYEPHKDDTVKPSVVVAAATSTAR